MCIRDRSYTVEEVISVLNQEYEGVASSDVIFKDFYQLKQERSEKVQVFFDPVEGHVNQIVP